ncbi:hypothetical protein CPB84DRAFT_1816234 [Gymnopilus junonius]|uniref:LSM domain-containing protein n=1 Tax=Gymnopilus junonius TaxID=109634 RepID=A0A9P5NL45_GYMJU|nr:hypothetical protein CPB84DRAFT_1816234 [Gymnopilus junonius]
MDDSPRPPSDQSPPPPPPPAQFLKGIVGKRVIVRLTSGVDYRGSACVLGVFWMMLIDAWYRSTIEHVNGIVTNRYGDAFIRGNNVLYISAAEPM